MIKIKYANVHKLHSFWKNLILSLFISVHFCSYTVTAGAFLYHNSEYALSRMDMSKNMNETGWTFIPYKFRVPGRER